MMNQHPHQLKANQPPMTSQSIKPNEEDTKILSKYSYSSLLLFSVDCSNELLQFSRPQQPPSYSEQYSKKKTQQKQKELLPSSTSISFTKQRKKIENATDRSELLISTSQDKILSPKTSYNFIPRSNSQKKVSMENNKSQIANCSEINYTNYNSHNTTCVYSSAEGYWQLREIEKKKKMEQIRNLNYQKEQNEIRDRPNISKNSRVIASHLRSKSKEQVFNRLSSGIDVRKKKEDIKNIEMRTRENRQPIINQSSQRLQRTIDDLYQWKVQIERKRLEHQTVTNCSFDPTPIINGESEVILKEKKPDYLRKRVEDRLIEQGEITRIKKEERKEHYHERIMASNEKEKCYMITCPSKKLLDKVRPQQNQAQNSFSVNAIQRNSSDKKYIQKQSTDNFIQKTESNSNKRSLSGRMKNANESNNNCEGDKATYSIMNTKIPTLASKPCSSSNIPSHNMKQNTSPQANRISNQDNGNLSYDIGSSIMQQQQHQPSPLMKNSINSNNNLVEIRKHLNDYYEQKAQTVNKSFSYKNTTNNNRALKKIPQNDPSKERKVNIQSQGIKTNEPIVSSSNYYYNSNNGRSKINCNTKNQMKNQVINQAEFEEDKIINQIPQNEPQVKYEPISFQEEDQWIPCGKNTHQQQQQSNYGSQIEIDPRLARNYPNEPKPIAYNAYQRNENRNSDSNNLNDHYFQNQQQNSYNYPDQYYSSQGNSPLKQSTQSNIDNNLIQPQKYNFNHDVFNRFTHQNQDKSKEFPKNNETPQQHQPQSHPRQYYTLSPESETHMPSSRFDDLPMQHIQSNIPSAKKYQDDNPLNKYRDETNKRLQDLEQMQQFANNLRESNDRTFGKKIAPNQNYDNNIMPQSQISNAKVGKLTGNMAYLNDRLKLNEKSKNFLYEKMNQISAYPSNISVQSNDANNAKNANANSYYQNSNYNLNANAFDFQRRKL